MAKRRTYTVIVSREIIESASFEIDATSDEEAIKIAKRAVADFDTESLDIEDGDWEYYDEGDAVEIESIHRGDAAGKVIWEPDDTDTADDGPETSGLYCQACSGPLDPGETCDCTDEEK